MKAGKHSFKRAAGVLLPVSSLPSPYGIGNFGKDARHWVDFLQDAGQTYWQTLPLSPTGEGDSPYQSFSAFAGNQFFIDFDTLREEGLLEREEYAGLNWGADDQHVDYKTVYINRELVLRKAFSRFTDIAALDGFILSNPWFEEYGLYMAIKAAQGLKGWLEWKEPLRNREKDAINQAKAEFSEDIKFHAFAQYQFDRQWSALRNYANAKGVRIIGDIPIYVSLDSADIWGNRNLFQLDKNHVPIEVSGCPPDYFSKEGQLWGNPLYDWEAMERSGYRWWISRLRKSFDLFDVMRIDHFRGLESYYAIPYGDATAENGHWKPGPGREFVDVIENCVKDAKIIAEDLGYHTDGVRELLEYSGYPGMKIVQYAFGNDATDDNIPYKYTADTVVYTGTHDNDTVKGWRRGASRACVRQALEYMGIRRERDIPDGMIRLALQSGSNIAIIPIQDWLGLGSSARMNTPSTVGGQNWRWRMSRGALTDRLAQKIARMTHIYGRFKEPEAADRRPESQNNWEV